MTDAQGYCDSSDTSLVAIDRELLPGKAPTNVIGGMTMRTIFSILLIIGFVQTTVSVRAEEQDVKVTAVMNGSTTIGGKQIEYPKTDKAEMASVLIDIQPGKESGRHMHPVPTYVHVLEGTLTVEFEDGSRRTFQA